MRQEKNRRTYKNDEHGIFMNAWQVEICVKSNKFINFRQKKVKIIKSDKLRKLSDAGFARYCCNLFVQPSLEIKRTCS